MRFAVIALLALGCSGHVEQGEETVLETPHVTVDAAGPGDTRHVTRAPLDLATDRQAPPAAWVAECGDGTDVAARCLKSDACFECLKSGRDGAECDCDRTSAECLLVYGFCSYSCDTDAGRDHCDELGGTCGEDRDGWCGPN